MNKDQSNTEEQKVRTDYVVSERPVVSREVEAGVEESSRNYENLGELPRSYGAPVLFAIARDPRTIFAYWDIDWPRTFGSNPPPDQKVFLRVLSEDGTQENRTPVEPMAGNCYIEVPRAGSTYRVELGYDERPNEWRSVATTESITTPASGVAEDSTVDVVTVPFHISFQRIVDLFRASKYDGEALTDILGNLQERAAIADAENPLTEDERELLRAADWKLSEVESQQRLQFRTLSAGQEFLEQRLEQILGFGPSSPGDSRGGGSRA